MSSPGPTAVIVLAAGEGTRMRSTTPKVLHTLAGRSMLGHTMAAGLGLAPSHLVVVVRHGRDAVAAAAQQVLGDVIIADQDDMPGTGRAVQCAMTALAQVGFGSAPTAGAASVVVIAGDTPLLDDATLAELVAAHHADHNVVTILTTRIDDPTGYGRILREPGTGAVTGIVEQRDATPEQLAITEVNTSIYVFDAAVLQTCLGRLGRDNAQGEVYLTDVIALARESGPVRAIECDDPLTVAGVNDRVHLAELRAELNRRLLDDWMRAGVTIVDPATTWVDVTVELAMDVTLLPGTQLHGTTVIGTGATIGPDTTLTDVIVGADASVVRTHGSGAQIGAGATVGPFSFLRPGAVLGGHGKIGAFVEVKNATIGEGSKVPHLSYVGDATIGDHSNIGASSVFANYDGVRKHHTTIGSHARTGSDTIFVAPVTIGDGAYTAAGSVIRRDVPPGALGVSGSSQRNIDGWVLSHRPGTAAAEAGAAALAAAADETPPDETASADTQPKDTAR